MPKSYSPTKRNVGADKGANDDNGGGDGGHGQDRSAHGQVPVTKGRPKIGPFEKDLLPFILSLT